MTSARDHGWLTRFVATPDKVLASGDPTAKDLFARYNQINMPNLGLGPEDVAAILDYLTGKSALPPAGSKAPPVVRSASAAGADGKLSPEARALRSP